MLLEAVSKPLRRCRGSKLPWHLLWVALRDALVGLDYLHRVCSVIHTVAALGFDSET